MNTINIILSESVVKLTYDDISDIDTDDILKVDYSNIVGEMLTFPVIMNRIGIIRSEANDAVRAAELDANVYKAQLSESFRKTLSCRTITAGGVQKMVKPTKDEVDNAVILDMGYRNKLAVKMKAEKNYEIIDSLYWSAKAKDSKLDAFGEAMVPAEFEKDLVESVINGIKIKGFKKPFPTKKV